MPYVKTTKKRYTKKRTFKPKTAIKRNPRTRLSKKRTYTIARPIATVQRGYLPFGPSFFAKLPFVENYPLAVTPSNQAIASTRSFNLNCMFQPVNGLTTHQPLQYDVLASHYERIWVYGAHVTLTFSDPNGDGAIVGYRVRANTNTLTTNNRNINHIQELRDCHARRLNNTGSQVTVFKFYVPCQHVLGVTKSQYGNLEYSHTATTTPPVFVWLEPFIGTHYTTGEVVQAAVTVQIRYYARFTNPISETQNN